MKKLLSVLLAILCVMNLTVVSFAAVETGTCGENVIWTLDESTETLIISGEGEIDSSGMMDWRSMHIRKAVIEEGVTSIGNDAFSVCTTIQSITIPDSVTSIGRRAFKSCGIESITIPDSVTSIGEFAFSNCSSLKSVVIGDGITNISKNAFSDCDSLENISWGNNVKVISNDAFAKCKNLTTVDLPDGLTSIGASAFLLCENLKDVSIPDSVTSIDICAFMRCRIERIILSSNLEYIGKSNFQGTTIYYEGSEEQWDKLCCDSGVDVQSYEIFYNYGQTKGQCGENAFWSFDEETGELTITGTGEMTDYSSSLIPWYNFVSDIKKVTIENGITSISKAAFMDCVILEKVVIPDGVNHIDESAFANCTSLKEITIPGSVTTFGKEAFKNCSNIVDIYYTGTVADWCNIDFNYDYDSNPKRYGENLYVDGKLLEANVVIPDSVSRIRDYTFYNCDGITNITIPDSVAAIGKSAFSGCSGLTSVAIPDSVTSIEQYAFSGCDGLANVVIGKGVTSIQYYTFGNCASLTDITFGNNVTSFSSGAFFNPSKVSINVHYTGNISEWCNINLGGLNYYWKDLYIDGTLVEGELVIPDSVTTINNYAFWNCDNITSVILPDSITSIGESVFEGCDNLTSVVYNGTEEQWSNVSVDRDNNKLNEVLEFYQPETPVTPETPDEPSEPTFGEKIVAFFEKVGNFFVSIYEWFVNLFKF